MKKKFLISSVVRFCLLFAFWLILSGHYDLFHISLGVFSVSLVTFLNWQFRKYFFYQDEIFKASPDTTKLNVLRFFLYLPWLSWQIVVASLQVAYVVLSPKMPIDPALIKFKTKLSNISSKVILGNSITLTPGTITMSIDDDEFMVHSLMDMSFSGIESDSLPKKVAQLYDKKPGQVVYDLKIIKSGKVE